MIPTPERPQANKVTLEELLRLKRAERPSPEFWSRFDQDLRAKQLAAIIEPRPWWITLRLPQIARTLTRYQLPAGAAAVLALSFVAIREYRPSVISADVLAGDQNTSEYSPAIVDSSGVVAEVVAPAASSAIASVSVDRSPAEQPVRVASVESLPVGPGELLAMIPWAAPQPAVAQPEPAPVVLGELPKVHFASAIKPAGEHRFEDSRVEAASVTVVAAAEPIVESTGELADILQASPVSPREVRRNRILSSLVVADNGEAVDGSRMAQVREILTSSLDNGQLYDSVRRVGMGGDRLTLKF